MRAPVDGAPGGALRRGARGDSVAKIDSYESVAPSSRPDLRARGRERSSTRRAARFVAIALVPSTIACALTKQPLGNYCQQDDDCVTAFCVAEQCTSVPSRGLAAPASSGADAGDGAPSATDDGGDASAPFDGSVTSPDVTIGDGRAGGDATDDGAPSADARVDGHS